MKDLRDPVAMGELLLEHAARHRAIALELRERELRKLPHQLLTSTRTLSELADYLRGTLEDHVQDYRHDAGPVEKYGDPRKQHEERIEAGLAERLP